MDSIYGSFPNQSRRTSAVMHENTLGRRQPVKRRPTLAAALLGSALSLIFAPAGHAGSPAPAHIDAAAPAAAPCVAPGCATTVAASTHPVGGRVISGTGSITQSGNVTDVQQSSQDVDIDWLSFSIGSQETVNFLQPSASAIAVNQIFSTNGSQILGHLNSNGQVWLINPNGVLFGQGAQVNVGGLVASTQDVSDSSPSGSSQSFSGAGPGIVINQGTINAANGGYVALLGTQVSNQGTITAKLGSVALGAGTATTLTFEGNSLVKMQVDQSSLNNLAANGGLIEADGGRVIMSAGAQNALLASVVNNTGVIEARTVENHDGTITLLAGMKAGTVNVDGTLDASAPNGGKGGLIETSAAQVQVANDAKVTTAAANGGSGTWVIDPTNFTIAASGGDITGVALATELDSGNVTILSSQGATGTLGNIYVNAAVTPAPTAATTLTLDAIGSIQINDPIQSTGSALNLSLNTATTGNVTLAAALTLAGGTVNVGTYNSTSGTVTPSVGTLNVTAGTTTLSGTLSTGTLAISGGQLNLDTATSVPTLSLTGGTLDGVAGVSTNAFSSSGGTLLGSLTLNSGGTGTISGSLGLYLGNGTTAGTFTNKGTITDSTTEFSMYMYANSVFNNQDSYTDNNSSNSYGFYATDTTSVINNSGTFTANPGTGHSIPIYPTFNNSGTVNVDSGTLLVGLYGTTATQSGAFDVASGATLGFEGGTQTITSTGTMSGAGTLEVGDGTLNYEGGYTLNSGIVITGGTANFTPTTGTMSPSSVTISGGTANFNTAINTSNVALTGGTLDGVAGMSTNAFSSSGGTLLGSLTLNSGGTGTISGSLGLYLGNGTTAGTFINKGTITDSTTEFSMYMYANSVFNNQDSYTDNNSSNSYGFYATDATSVINNSGTFTANPGTGHSIHIYPTFNNSGTVNVSNGTLALSNTGASATDTGVFNLSSGATLDIAGGTQTITTGTVSGAGTVEVSGGQLNLDTTATIPVLNLTGGTLDGATGANTNNLTASGGTLLGSLTLNSGGTGTLSGSSGLYLGNGTTAGTFINKGTITDSTTEFSMYMYANSVFNNQDTYTDNNSSNSYGFYATDATSVFNNSGTFTANPGTGHSIAIYPTFNNSGTVNVSNGTLALGYSGASATDTGVFNLSLGATLDFAAGTQTITTGTVSGAGTVEVSGGTLNLNTTATIPVLNLTGGTLDGATGANTNNLTASGGTLLGSLTLNSGGTGTLSGSSGLSLGNGTTAGTFTNNGTITDSTTEFSMYMYKNSVFNNQGSYTDNNSSNSYGFYATDTTSVFNNSGTFTANPGTGHSTPIYPVFINTGTVNVNSGTLALGVNGGTVSYSGGGFSIASGATLDFAGGTQTITTGTVSGAGAVKVSGGQLNLDTTAAIPTLELTSGGIVNGATGANTNNLIASGGTLLGSLTLNSGGTGTLSGSSGLYLGNGTTAGTFTNKGTITDSTTEFSMYMYANSVFNNQGSYTDNNSSNSYGFYATDTTSVVNNSGTLTANPGNGKTLYVYPAFKNSGTVNVDSGTLSATGTLTQSGTINVASSTIFSDTAGFTNTGTLEGTGKIVVGTGSSELVNEGNIDPGATGVAGTLTISGAVELSTGSDLNMALGGTAAGQFDLLSVSGALSGNAGSFGALTLSEIDGYVPTVLAGTPFELVTAASGGTSATFASFHLARTTSTATYATTNVTVNVAPDVLTVTPTSGQTKVYGTSDPVFAFTATGFDPTTSDDAANSLSGLLARAAGVNVGSYAINQGTLVSTDGYWISFTSGVNFSITPATLTVSGLAGTNRTYNGSVVDALSGTAVLNGLVGTDTLVLGNDTNGTLASKNAGSEPITTGLTIANGTGLASNYTLVQPSLSNVTISRAPITITGLSGTNRTYNGTVVDALAGTAVLNGLIGTETLTLDNVVDGTLASKNAGSEAVTTDVTLANGTGRASNYTLTQPTLANVTIAPAALTISATSDSKTYDGTTDSSQTPTVTAGTVFSGDTLSALTQSFASKNVLGTNGSTLDVNSYTLNDGNGGNNYTVTVDSATGTITPASLVINAVGQTKTYDGTTTATAIPTVTGTIYSGDSLSSLTESYASKNALGTNGSTLNVNSYTLNDGNGGNNYSVTVDSATGTITPLASIAWVGGATGNWSTASNWAGGIVPDLSNVLAVTIAKGKTVTYDSGVVGTTILASLTDSGNLVMAAGDLSTTGNLSTAGFQQTGGTLDVGGTLSIKSTSGSGVTLGDITAGMLSVSSKAGAITQLASTTLDVTGTTSLTADNGLTGASAVYYGITLTDAGNQFVGAVTSTGSNIDLFQNTGGLILGATTANGTLTVDSLDGAITQAKGKAVDVTGATSLTANNGGTVNYGITLANATNNFGGTVAADGLAISLLDSSSSGLTLGTVTASGALTVTSRAGAITQAASTTLDVTGTTTLTADNGLTGASALDYGITLADAGNQFVGAVTSTGSSIDLVQGTGGLILGSTSANGTLSATALNGSITQSKNKAVDVVGTTSLTSDNGASGFDAITLGQSGNNFGGAVTADGSAVTLEAAGALTAVLDSSGASTLTSVGAMDVSGTVGTTLKTTTTGTSAATNFGATTVGTSLTVVSTGSVTETSSNILTVDGKGTTTVSNSKVTVNGVKGAEIPVQ